MTTPATDYVRCPGCDLTVRATVTIEPNGPNHEPVAVTRWEPHVLADRHVCAPAGRWTLVPGPHALPARVV